MLKRPQSEIGHRLLCSHSAGWNVVDEEDMCCIAETVSTVCLLAIVSIGCPSKIIAVQNVSIGKMPRRWNGSLKRLSFADCVGAWLRSKLQSSETASLWLRGVTKQFSARVVSVYTTLACYNIDMQSLWDGALLNELATEWNALTTERYAWMTLNGEFGEIPCQLMAFPTTFHCRPHHLQTCNLKASRLNHGMVFDSSTVFDDLWNVDHSNICMKLTGMAMEQTNAALVVPCCSEHVTMAHSFPLRLSSVGI